MHKNNDKDYSAGFVALPTRGACYTEKESTNYKDLESWLKEAGPDPDTIVENRHSNTTSSDKLARLPTGAICKSTIRSYHHVSFFHMTGSADYNPKRRIGTILENSDDEDCTDIEPKAADHEEWIGPTAYTNKDPTDFEEAEVEEELKPLSDIGYECRRYTASKI